MRFPYSAFLSPSPATGEEVIIFRPELPLRIHGAIGSGTYMALVDTGADNTILPLSIARELNIATHECKGPSARAFGGQSIPLSFADIRLGIGEPDVSLRWNARVHFFDFTDAQPKAIVVGHEGFLDFFTSIFDGSQMVLDLEPDDDMPRV